MVAGALGQWARAAIAPLGVEIIAGLLPPNRLPDAIENDHPENLRALWVDSNNPVNTVADTQRVLAAMAQLDLMVVVDVAFTKTAALADYVLPAASQFEKCEYTLFSFEYPSNYVHVRRPVLPPLAGTLSEPEIYTRLAQALNLLPPPATLAELAAAARRSYTEFGTALEAFMADNVNSAACAPLLLYNTLGMAMPTGTAAAAPLWAAVGRLARTRPAVVAAALAVAADLPARELAARLFDHIINAPSGVAFRVETSVWDLLETADQKAHLAIVQLMETMSTLDPQALQPNPDYPFVLFAGQRRAQNANQNFRDPAFRKRDPDGALFIHPEDLASLAVADGAWLVVESTRGELVVRTHVDAGLRRGYVVLPHGYGQAYPSAGGERLVCGPPVNWLTDRRHRDPIASTPLHKNIPVPLRPAGIEQATAAEHNSAQIRLSARAT